VARQAEQSFDCHNVPRLDYLRRCKELHPNFARAAPNNPAFAFRNFITSHGDGDALGNRGRIDELMQACATPQKVDTWRRDTYIKDAGYATVAGLTNDYSTSSAIADACVKALNKLLETRAK